MESVSETDDSPTQPTAGAAAPTPSGAEEPPVAERLAAIERRLASLETSMEQAARQVALLPPQVRSLTSKLDGVATAISEPRVRDLLNGLLTLYDLAEQSRQASLVAGDDERNRRNYEVLRTQIRQLLEANGLNEIPAPVQGTFDPQQHRAVLRTTVETPEQHGRIVQVVRAGFRTEQAVLRYAEVAVGQYHAPAAGDAGAAPAPEE
jgi:molecular chaperone GrpE (heat shock protein)